MLGFTGMNLEFDVVEEGGGQAISSLVGSLCGDVLWEGSFLHGCGQGDAEAKAGSFSQHEMMNSFLHEFPMLNSPPDPPKLEIDMSSFDVPKSHRGDWVEQAKEAEQRAVEEARELSEKAAAREQETMEKATMNMMNIAEEEEEGGGRGKAAGKASAVKNSNAKKNWKKAVGAAKVIGAVQRRHQLNSTIFGVPGNPPSMNYMIPDPPPHRRRFGVVHSHSRICGGVMHPPVKPDVTKIGMPKDVLPKLDLAFPTVSAQEARQMRTKTGVESKKGRAKLSIDSTVSTFGSHNPAAGMRPSLVSIEAREEEDEEGFEDLTELGGRGRKRGSSMAQHVGGGRSRRLSTGLFGGEVVEMDVVDEEADEVQAEEPAEEPAKKREPEPEPAKAGVAEEKHVELVDPKESKTEAPPPGLQAAAARKAGEGPLDLWECRCDPTSNYAYYVHKKTGQGAWTPPEGSTQEELAEFTRQYQEFYQRIVLAKWQEQQQQVASSAEATTATGGGAGKRTSAWAGAISAQVQQAAAGGTGGEQAQQTSWDDMTSDQKAYYTWYYKAQAKAQQQKQ